MPMPISLFICTQQVRNKFYEDNEMDLTLTLNQPTYVFIDALFLLTRSCCYFISSNVGLSPVICRFFSILNVKSPDVHEILQKHVKFLIHRVVQNLLSSLPYSAPWLRFPVQQFCLWAASFRRLLLVPTVSQNTDGSKYIDYQVPKS